MSDIQTSTGINNTYPQQLTQPPISTPSTNDNQPPVDMPDVVTKSGLHVSAEAQYLFEMYGYLSKLDDEPREKVLAYLSQSNDPLQQKAVVSFRESYEILRPFREGRVTFDNSKLQELQDRVKFDPNAVVPEIGIMPMGTEVFRLDGDKNFNPVQLSTFNDPLRRQLDALEKASDGILGLQDSVTLFGSVRNALGTSENILLSLDDVLHFNYMIEKANKAISFIKAPENIKSALKKILNQSIVYQNNKQSKFLDDTKSFLGNARVGNLAKENIRLGSAAQLYNNQLQGLLRVTNTSLLNGSGIITKLLMQNTDLIRFGPAKIGEAIAYYQEDFKTFQRHLNKDFSILEVEKEPEIDTGSILKIGSNYALKVIEGIKNYVSI